jgi:hypothetical protein
MSRGGRSAAAPMTKIEGNHDDNETVHWGDLCRALRLFGHMADDIRDKGENMRIKKLLDQQMAAGRVERVGKLLPHERDWGQDEIDCTMKRIAQFEHMPSLFELLHFASPPSPTDRRV